MNNIDLTDFNGKDANIVLKKADELFNESLEGKIHAHKIYSRLLDKEKIKHIVLNAKNHENEAEIIS